MNTRTVRLMLAALMVLMAACTPPQTSEQSVAPDTPVPPTATSPPTETPAPTATPTATPTPTPVPDPWGDVLISAGTPLPIAVVAPLNGSAASLGTLMMQAAQMAVDDYGAVQGYSAELTQVDDTCASGSPDETFAPLDTLQPIAVIGLCPSDPQGFWVSAELTYFESKHIPAMVSGPDQTGLAAAAPGVFNRTILNRDQMRARQSTFNVSQLEPYIAFAQQFQEKYGTAIPANQAGIVAGTYDATTILLAAIDTTAEKDGATLKIGRQKLSEAVRATQGHEGVSGVISFDDKGYRIPPVIPDAWGDVRVPPGETIKLAAAGPLSGDASGLFDQGPDAVAFASSEFGPIQGFSVEVLSFDTGCSPEPEPATTAANEIVANPQMAGVVGPFCSPSALTMIPALRTNHIVAISPAAQRPDLPGMGGGMFFRVILNANQTGPAGVDPDGFYVNELASAQEFYAAFGAATGTNPDDRGPNKSFLAYTYDATLVLLTAMNEVAQLEPDGTLVIGRQALINAIRARQDLEGATGPIQFTSGGDRVPPSR